ncbi:MAG: ferrous iron transporter B [Myxococcales bacterium]|nr:ferrous iron transporter B [Myxococcales bacterium]
MNDAQAASDHVDSGAGGVKDGEGQGRARESSSGREPLVVMVGRPNSGKSSLFNAVTGSSARVGNFPGVTVDVLESEARLADGTKIELADLPGLYTIDPNADAATDEGVAAKFITDARNDGRPVVLMQVLDATHLGLHLRLTTELARLELPLVVAVSQVDLLKDAHRAINIQALEAALGATVVAVSARSASAKADVLSAIERCLKEPSPPRTDFDPVLTADGAIRVKGGAEGRAATERLDGVLLHPLAGPVLFVLLMASLFAAVFLISDPVTTVLDGLIARARAAVESRVGTNLVASFISDGLLGGAGTVLAFLPQIVVLTLAMELLDASGYLARGAFLVDRLLRLMGLSGRSFLPLLMSHACAVPAISATRIVRDPKERLTAILVLPLMTCSARIPTYALVVSTFFFSASAFRKAAIFVVLYFAGLASGLVASLILRRTAVRGRSLPLVLEMPGYRMPQPTVVARQAWRAASRFLREVGTTIVVASAVLWAVLTLPSPWATATATESATMTATAQAPRPTPIEKSVAASVGRALEPVTKPLGFDWRINVGLIGSFGARELMVGTLGIIFGIDDAGADPAPLSERLRSARGPSGTPLYPTRTGLALLAFFVVACQCMSTVAAIRRETRSLRWPAFVLAYTYAAAYVLALAVHGVAGAMGL